MEKEKDLEIFMEPLYLLLLAMKELLNIRESLFNLFVLCLIKEYNFLFEIIFRTVIHHKWAVFRQPIHI